MEIEGPIAAITSDLSALVPGRLLALGVLGMVTIAALQGSQQDGVVVLVRSWAY